MTKLAWNAPGERFFEMGVDRGVLYPPIGKGVPWNGLVSVTETPTGGESTPYYQDGVKQFNDISREDFAATIEAFTYPDEFELCEGVVSVDQGFFAHQQQRREFGLSYRTRLGNDTEGLDHGYKIHLVYNALAGPTDRANETINETPEGTSFSWPITATPVIYPGLRPTAHFTLVSTKLTPLGLRLLEDILYGNNTYEPRMPFPAEIVEIINYIPPVEEDIFTATFGERF